MEEVELRIEVPAWLKIVHCNLRIRQVDAIHLMVMQRRRHHGAAVDEVFCCMTPWNDTICSQSKHRCHSYLYLFHLLYDYPKSINSLQCSFHNRTLLSAAVHEHCSTQQPSDADCWQQKQLFMVESNGARQLLAVCRTRRTHAPETSN